MAEVYSRRRALSDSTLKLSAPIVIDPTLIRTEVLADNEALQDTPLILKETKEIDPAVKMRRASGSADALLTKKTLETALSGSSANEMAYLKV